jgi:hypothetical protein
VKQHWQKVRELAAAQVAAVGQLFSGVESSGVTGGFGFGIGFGEKGFAFGGGGGGALGVGGGGFGEGGSC